MKEDVVSWEGGMEEKRGGCEGEGGGETQGEEEGQRGGGEGEGKKEGGLEKWW